jgi:hypothetical protein
VPDALISFLRARLTIGQLAILDTHGQVRLDFWYESYSGPPNSWGPRHVAIEVCASCSPELTPERHRREWIPPYGDEHLRVIPTWVQRWPCRYLLAVAAGSPDGTEWRHALRAREPDVDAGDQRRCE